jgi:hypothetical protein
MTEPKSVAEHNPGRVSGCLDPKPQYFVVEFRRITMYSLFHLPGGGRLKAGHNLARHCCL